MIFIVGMPAAGKSFFGEMLAKKISCEFIDLDAQIEAEHATTIPQLFEKIGETGFRAIERDELRKFTKKTPIVLATGGGTPCFYENMAFMLENGTVIWLNTPKDIVVQRLLLNENRPLLQNILNKTTNIQEKTEAVSLFYDKLLAERLVFYEQANEHFVFP